MTNLWSDVREVYGSAWAFAFACPLLFLVPVLAEFAQHVVEIDLGLYDSLAGAKAAESHPARMAWGFAKTLAITLPTYWFYRYVVSGQDAAYARRLDGRALALWGAIYLVMSVALGWLGIFGLDLGGLLGLEGSALTIVRIALAVGQIAVGIYLVAWFVAWSQGNAAIGPVRSLRIMRGFFWRTAGLMVCAILPLMVLHYAGLFAIGRPQWAVWTIMLLDSFVVGFLALTIAGANAVAAQRAASVRGISLLSGREAPERGSATVAGAQPTGC